jgi:hypothetical protein
LTSGTAEGHHLTCFFCKEKEEEMTQVKPINNEPHRNNLETLREQTAIDRVLRRLSSMELPGKDHFENYLRHKWRLNHKPKTMESSFTSVVLFLRFYRASGKKDIKDINVLTSKPSSSMSRTERCISPR